MKTKKVRAARARAEAEARIAAAHWATQQIVMAGRCPTCGAGLRRNSALAGWWQCEQFGAEGWRKDSTQAPCDWQGFTEIR